MTRRFLAFAFFFMGCGGRLTPDEQSIAPRPHDAATDAGSAVLPAAPVSTPPPEPIISAAPAASSTVPPIPDVAVADAGAESLDAETPTIADAAAASDEGSAIVGPPIDTTVSDAGFVPQDAAIPIADATITDASTTDAGIAQAQPPTEIDAGSPAASTPASTMELPSCAGHPTTSISIVANLDAIEAVPLLAWDRFDPANTSNFSTTMTVYAAFGWQGTLDVYFRKIGDLKWQYHGLLYPFDVPIEVANGILEYTMGDGVLYHHEVIMPLRLPNPDGSWGPEIKFNLGTAADQGGSGMDGITSYPEPENVSAQVVDGNYATFAVGCKNSAISTPPNATPISTVPPPAPLSKAPHCAPQATRNLNIVANLKSDAKIVGVWDPRRPSIASNFGFDLSAIDGAGATAALSLYFQKLDAHLWRYHVLLEGDMPVVEVGTGDLEFNPSGSLSSTTVILPLALPDGAGHANDPIKVDFGEPTQMGGNGVDGVTSFATGTRLQTWTTDGLKGTIGADCPVTPYAPFPWFISCTSFPCCDGQFTTKVTGCGQLPPTLPLVANAWSSNNPVGTSTLFSSTSLFDASGRTIPMTVYYRHIDATTWEYQAQVTESGVNVHLGSGKLVFAHNGMLQHQEGFTDFRLPLADGAPGPVITLGFGTPADQGGPLWSYLVSMPESTGDLHLSANGDLASSASQCPER